ncbi:class I SAM-dependent methyltransferase [Actinoplanes sp. NPDC049681]|uniref:class I SAM-dependent methyltransferase n=1 Tax=Actinoplanes sp. NPDC049681 TaxID=3363905 RepID=UPI0037B33D67
MVLARSGRTVIGLDPAAASVEVARAKDGAAAVEWQVGDAAGVPACDADLAVMTGNVAQVFLTDEDWLAALRGVRGALRPGGHFVFETRRPGYRAWEEWAADMGTVVRDVVGPVEQSFALTAVELPLVSFRFTYRFRTGGSVVVSDSTLRFRRAR